MSVAESHHHVKRNQRRISKLYYPYHFTLSFLGSIFPFRRLYTHIQENTSMSSSNVSPYLDSKHAVAKLFGLVLGGMVLFLSTYASLDSPWYADHYWRMCNNAQVANTSLEWKISSSRTLVMASDSCPGIWMERFLVFSSWSIVVMSTVCLIGCCLASIETINALRKKDAILNVFFGVIYFTGGVLFMITPIRLLGNSCRLKETGMDSDRCELFFKSNTKYVVGAIGIAVGVSHFFIACVLENVKLYGMNVHNKRQSSAQSGDDGPPPRQSIYRSRKSSVPTEGRSSKVKKGVGSFGAVTSNMSHRGIGSENYKNTDLPGVTFSAPNTEPHHHSAETHH